VSEHQDTGASVSVVSQRSVGDLTGLNLGSNLEIQDRIGRGGMGSVYLARHRDWNLSLAVKSPRPDLLTNDTDKERWLLEAQTWIDLGVHPNIVRCWFIREHEGIPLLFLDYIAGGSLKEALEQRRYGVANWPKVIDLAIQACDGLHHSHVCGIVHRDVKPANLLLDDDGHLFVTDFGLVKMAGSSDERQRGKHVDLSHSDASLTSTGTVLGTPNYCAPEQWMQDDVGVPADLYALGVVLYEMAVGQLPFEAGPGPLGLGQLLSQVLSEDPKPPSHLQPSIPPALEATILKLLAKEPRGRHASASQLRDELAGIYQDITQTPYPRPVPKPVEAVVDVLNNKAVSLYSLGRKKPAEETWQQALRLDSLHPEVVYNRGWLLWRQGRHTPSDLTGMLKQVKVTYRRGAVHCGLAHLLGGEAELAEQNLDAALAEVEAASDSSVWRHLGDARMSLERFDEAVQAYHQALRINPLDQAARQYLDMASHKTRRVKGRCLFPKQQPLLHMKRQHRLTSVQKAGGGWLWLGPEHMELLPADSGRRSWSVCHDVGLRKVVVSASADKVIAIEDLPAGVWALDSGLLESTLTQGERHYCLSPDGLQCVVGLVEVRLQNLKDGTFGRPLRGHQKQVMCATFCGSDRLLTGSCDRTARCWDIDKAKCLQVLQGHRDYVTCVAYSPETGLALTGSNDGSARTWRLDTGECFRVLEEGHGVHGVAFAGKGRYAVVQSMVEKEHTTSIWDLRSGELGRRLTGLSRVSPDGDYLVTARTLENRHLLEIREAGTGCLRRTLTVEDGPISDCCFSDDGRFLAVVTLSGSFYLFEFDEAYRVIPKELMLTYTRGGQDLEESRELFLGLLRQAETACSQGEFLVSRKHLQQARDVPGYRRDPQARALTRRLGQHLNRGALLSCWEVRLLGSAGGTGLSPILLLPGGNRMLTANDKILRLWDCHLGNCIRGFPGHSESIRALSINADGTQAVSGSLDRGVRCWDLESGQCIQRVAASRGGVTGLHWLAGTSRVIALTNQYLLCGIDFEADEEVFQVPAPGLTWMVGVGEQVWLGGPITPGRLQLVHGKTGKVTKKFTSSESAEATLLATAAVAYGDGRYGVSASPDGKIHLWDLSEGRHLGRLLDIQARVACLAISPDGLCLAVGLDNGWVQIWDLERRHLCQVVEGPWGKLCGLALSLDSCELYLLGSDQVLRVWEMEWELLEQSTRRQLTDTLPKAGLLSRLWRGLRG
jgi:serine/threonine protein kinase/WD40 repeat protein